MIENDECNDYKKSKWNLQDGVLMANRSSPVPRFLLAGLHNNSTLLLRWHQADDDDNDNDNDDNDFGLDLENFYCLVLVMVIILHNNSTMLLRSSKYWLLF